MEEQKNKDLIFLNEILVQDANKLSDCQINERKQDLECLEFLIC